MSKPSKPRLVHSSGAPLERLASGEWPILRACWRVGPAAPTADIVRELQEDGLIDYRNAQTVLRRLVKKGYLEVEKQGPRRNVYTSTCEAGEVLRQEVRTFVDQVVGLEPENIALVREVLDDLEKHGPFAAFDQASLPRDLRGRLIELVDGFIESKRNRWALAAAFGVDRRNLDKKPTLAGAISLLMGAGGDTISAALQLLDAIEELLEETEADKASEVAAIRHELQALSTD